jgi:hypothetical protein
MPDMSRSTFRPLSALFRRSASLIGRRPAASGFANQRFSESAIAY